MCVCATTDVCVCVSSLCVCVCVCVCCVQQHLQQGAIDTEHTPHASI